MNRVWFSSAKATNEVRLDSRAGKECLVHTSLVLSIFASLKRLMAELYPLIQVALDEEQDIQQEQNEQG